MKDKQEARSHKSSTGLHVRPAEKGTDTGLHMRPAEKEIAFPSPQPPKPPKPPKPPQPANVESTGPKKNKRYVIHPTVKGYTNKKAGKTTVIVASNQGNAADSSESKTQPGMQSKGGNQPGDLLLKKIPIYVSKKKGCLVATVKDFKAGMYTVEFTDGSVAKYSKSELKWRMSLANAMNNEAKSGAFPERVGRLRFLKIDPRGALFNRQDLAPG